MGSLPFDSTASVSALDGTAVIESLPITVWPTGGANDEAGRYYDHQAECPMEHYDDLRAPNLKLVHDGITYGLVEVVRHSYFPHVALSLREARPGG